MKYLISPFPVLQSECLNTAITYRFFFNDDSNQLQEMEYDPEAGVLQSKTWSADKFNLKICVDLTLSDIKNLFSGPTAVAQEDAVIGVAVCCQVMGLNHRKFFVFDNCCLTKENDSVHVTKEIEFPRHFLKNKLDWEIVLFLKNSASGDFVYAQKTGSLLGVLDKKTLNTGGGNGIFTTVWREAGPLAPLWDIDLQSCSVEDPLTADFFILSLNSNHCAKDFVFITKDKLSPMLFEIFADACFILLKKAASSDFTIDSNVSSVQTVGDYINIMLKKLFPEWGKGDLCVDDHLLMKNIRQNLLTAGIKISTSQMQENDNE